MIENLDEELAELIAQYHLNVILPPAYMSINPPKN